MSQTVNGVLYVESFTPTANPGEYTFENGVYNTQNDVAGDGALAIDTSFVMFTPVVDTNTSMPIVGAVNRYKFTNLTYIDTVRISGTILFDEADTEIGAPGNGVFCLVSKVTPNKRLAPPPLDDIYSDLFKGGTVAAMLNDLINILDKSDSNTTTPLSLLVQTDGQTEFTLPAKPVNVAGSVLLVNGVSYSYGLENDFNIVGNVLTFTNTSFLLETTDSVVLR